MDLDFDIITAEEAKNITIKNLTTKQKSMLKNTVSRIEKAAKSGSFSISFEGSDDDFRLCCLVFKDYKLSCCLNKINISWQ